MENSREIHADGVQRHFCTLGNELGIPMGQVKEHQITEGKAILF